MASKFSLEASLNLVDRFTGPLNKIKGGADSFSNQMSKSFGRVNTALDGMQKRAGNMAKEMAPLAMAGTGMIMAGQQISSAGKSILSSFDSIISEGASFEKTMSDVAAVARVDKTSQAFKDLEDTAMQLGASTQFSAAQVGEGMKYLAMAGFDANQQIAAMPDMLKLAQVGNIDLATAADIASNTLGAFKLQAEDMNRVANVMSATMTRSNVDMAMLADTFKYAAPVAQAVGVSIEDLAAMTGLLGDVGIQGSQAGTALRAAMVRLTKPPKMAANALADLGVATMDAKGNMRALPSILEDIRVATDKMGTGKRMEAISAIFGTEASAAFAELISKANEGGKSITGFAESIQLATQADELAQVAKSMSDNVEGAGLAFDSAASAVKIGIFNSFKDTWKEILQIGANVLLWLYGLIKNNKTLVKWISIIVGIVGVLLVVFGSLITFGGMLAGAFVFMSIAAAMFGLSLSAALWPVTLVIVAIIALIAIGILLYENWASIKEFFVGVWDSIVSGAQAAYDWLADGFKYVYDTITYYLTQLKPYIDMAADFFSPLFVVANALGAVWDWLYDKISGIVTAIADKASAVAQFFGFDEQTAQSQKEIKPAVGKGAQNTVSPMSSMMEKINREQVDINIAAPPGTTAERKGKKSPGVSLNMGANGACA